MDIRWTLYGRTMATWRSFVGPYHVHIHGQCKYARTSTEHLLVVGVLSVIMHYKHSFPRIASMNNRYTLKHKRNYIEDVQQNGTIQCLTHHT